MPVAKRARKSYPTHGTVGAPRPFPTRLVARLQYATTVSVTSSLTGIGNYIFACNSIYDPDTSSTGHQPYGHDTYANIYNQYTVLSSRIKVQASLGNSANSYTWGIGIEDATPSTGNPDFWMERPTYVKRLQAARDAPDAKPLTLSWNRAKRFPQEDVYRSLSAPFGANPAEMEFYNIVIQSYNPGTVALGTVYLTVTIEYIVEMYELKDLGTS